MLHASPKDEFNDGESTNPSANSHINDLLAARLSRRHTLKGGIGLTTGVLLSSLGLTACGGGDDDNASAEALKLGFAAVAMNKNDIVTVPAGYEVGILHALGDPMHWGINSWADNGSESADSYNSRIGDGHDGMHYFGLSEAGKFDANRSERGLLCVNHEYVVAPYALHPNGKTAGAARIASEVEKEIYAHGVSVVEVKRDAKGAGMGMVRGSRFNRRVTSATPMAFAGPVKGSELVKTRFSPDGMKTRGTNNNCANGYTPWGTYLTCEENYTNVISRAAGDDAQRSAKEITGLKRYGMTDGRKSPYLWDTAGSDDLFARWNSAVTGASAGDDYRNIFNTFGWVVEIDPFNPDSTPVKRSTLGRFNHEGAWPVPAVKGQPVVIYSGDDSRNEYIYKYVSKALWDEADVNGGLAAGAKYLDKGKLYVAVFKADGTGTWEEISIDNPKIKGYANYAFADQADVLVHTRLAADAVGATKMDRPEWGAVNPLNHEVYMTLTNNSNRVAHDATPTGVQLKPDAANPRPANNFGHILRWRESQGNPAATTFDWDIFALAGDPLNPAADKHGNIKGDAYGSPDGLWFDPSGRLWIQTDVSTSTLNKGDYANLGNNQMLVADVDTGATRRFLSGPRGCELTGITATPDGRTLFVNIQHPGETPSERADPASPTAISAWPANQFREAVGGRPRSATLAISRDDGKAFAN